MPWFRSLLYTLLNYKTLYGKLIWSHAVWLAWAGFSLFSVWFCSLARGSGEQFLLGAFSAESETFSFKGDKATWPFRFRASPHLWHWGYEHGSGALAGAQLCSGSIVPIGINDCSGQQIWQDTLQAVPRESKSGWLQPPPGCCKLQSSVGVGVQQFSLLPLPFCLRESWLWLCSRELSLGSA